MLVRYTVWDSQWSISTNTNSEVEIHAVSTKMSKTVEYSFFFKEKKKTMHISCSIIIIFRFHYTESGESKLQCDSKKLFQCVSHFPGTHWLPCIAPCHQHKLATWNLVDLGNNLLLSKFLCNDMKSYISVKKADMIHFKSLQNDLHTKRVL